MPKDFQSPVFSSWKGPPHILQKLQARDTHDHGYESGWLKVEGLENNSSETDLKNSILTESLILYIWTRLFIDVYKFVCTCKSRSLLAWGEGKITITILAQDTNFTNIIVKLKRITGKEDNFFIPADAVPRTTGCKRVTLTSQIPSLCPMYSFTSWQTALEVVVLKLDTIF